MTIRNKLRFGLATIMLLLLVVCVLFISRMSKTIDHSAALVDAAMPKVALVSRISVEVAYLSISQALHIVQDDATRMSREEAELAIHVSQAQGLLLQLETLAKNRAQRNAIEELSNSLEAFVQNETALIDASKKNNSEDQIYFLNSSARLLDKLLASLRNLEILIGNESVDAQVEEAALFRETKNYVIGLAAFAVVFLLSLSVVLRQTILKPVDVLVDYIEKLAAGDLDSEVPLANKTDEIGGIARALFHFRTNALERRRLQKQEQDDLDFAHNLQLSSVPRRYPAFPERAEIDLFGELTPCRSVGGDFFDFYLLDDRRLALTIADTSGKGVGAALFASAASNSLRLGSLRSADPAQCLVEANEHLSAGNEAMMFVTAFHAVLDLGTGELIFGNAGHVPPLCRSATGVIRPLTVEPGLPLGVMAGVPFDLGRTILEPGDTIVFVTDGVTEAMDSNGVLWGEEGLAQAFEAMPLQDCKSTGAAVMTAVRGHLGAAAQNDDIAIVVLRWNGVSAALTN